MTVDINSMSNDLIRIICNYITDPQIKRHFGQTNRRISEVFYSIINSIRVFAPHSFLLKDYSADIPKNILVKAISRYPNLQKIIFGPPKNGLKQNGFEKKDLPYLIELASLEKPPLNKVKRIRFEITGLEEAETFNSLFSGSIENNLEKITIKTSDLGSFSGLKIQSVLNNSPNLKRFVFDGQAEKIVSLSFAHLPKLSKVKLLNWTGTSKTVGSLKNCKELKELVIHTDSFSHKISLGELSSNLRHLELKGIAFESADELDLSTKGLRNLESLSVSMQNISDEGMQRLGKNCPNLKIFDFAIINLTNSGLNELTKKLPLLEMICIEKAGNITEEGIANLAKNCKNLKILRVLNYKKIEKTGIDALIENCQELRAVEFWWGGPIAFEDLSRLIENLPKLRYFKFLKAVKYKDEQIIINGLYNKFPHITDKIPAAPTVKQLFRLIMKH